MINRNSADGSFYKRKFWTWGLFFLLGLAVFFILHIALGQVALTPREVMLALLNNQEDLFHRQIVWELRLPRTLIALDAGAMLGLAGAILQSVTRNPLAEPGLLGVSAGSVLMLVLYMTYLGGSASLTLQIPLFGLVGGIITVSAIYLLGWSRRGDALRFTVIGLLISAFLSACTSLVLLRHSEAIGSILLWTVGSLNGRVWIHWNILWPWFLIMVPIGLISAGAANALQLGDGVARGIGVPVGPVRAGLLLIAALLTAGAVSIVGAVGFIGLIGPHIARRIVGQDARRLFPFSALVTAWLLVGSDILSQGLSIPLFEGGRPASLPVGAVTAFMGAPFFIYLARRHMK
ncbi:FecCD family ABC transporter permease [Paenibacillus campinasensis]|uniref:ABC transporter permease n=1 Tax=Paenibacillus campinasensis TaxID=66347 RepID=A0A268F059_9BACL|nr:iron ABC transporter permease [Paenibacillus campinasensis]PAD78741.1 ABC transporter permease [Paenibacillus campinasensis]